MAKPTRNRPFSDSQVAAIRQMADSGCSVKEIASAAKTTYTTLKQRLLVSGPGYKLEVKAVITELSRGQAA